MPQGDFFSDMNAALPDMQKVFGENWTLERTGKTWDAISIDRETLTSEAMSGGQYIKANTMIFISEDVMSRSTVRKGDIVIARTDRFSVREIDKDGDASRILVCGPVSVNVFSK